MRRTGRPSRLRSGAMGVVLAIALLGVAWVSHAQPEVRPSADDVRGAIDAILASGEFATGLQSDLLARLVERVQGVLQRIVDALGRLFSGLGASAGASDLAARITQYVVLSAAAAIVLYLLFLLCRWVVRRLSSVEEGAGPFAATAAVEPLAETPGRVSTLRRRAREAQANGDLRQALRYYFLAYLAYLSALGLIRFSPRNTNGDYARDLAGTPSWREAFGAAAGRFELAWYGGVPPVTADVLAVEALSRGGEGDAA